MEQTLDTPILWSSFMQEISYKVAVYGRNNLTNRLSKSYMIWKYQAVRA